MPKQNKMGHKVYKNTIEMILCRPGAPGRGTCLASSWCTQWDSIGEDWFAFLYQWVSLAIASWLGMGAHVAWTSGGPVCAVTVSGWRVLCLPCSQLSPLTILLPPLPQRSQSLERRALMKSSHWGPSALKPFPPCTLSSCWSLHQSPSTTRSFSDEGQARHWPISIAVCHWSHLTAVPLAEQ